MFSIIIRRKGLASIYVVAGCLHAFNALGCLVQIPTLKPYPFLFKTWGQHLFSKIPKHVIYQNQFSKHLDFKPSPIFLFLKNLGFQTKLQFLNQSNFSFSPKNLGFQTKCIFYHLNLFVKKPWTSNQVFALLFLNQTSINLII
jgi:hypothetical protein